MADLVLTEAERDLLNRIRSWQEVHDRKNSEVVFALLSVAQAVMVPGVLRHEVALHLNHNEAQAILNALRESNVFPAPMVFEHVQSLAEKTQAGLRRAGFEPL